MIRKLRCVLIKLFSSEGDFSRSFPERNMWVPLWSWSLKIHTVQVVTGRAGTMWVSFQRVIVAKLLTMLEPQCEFLRLARCQKSPWSDETLRRTSPLVPGGRRNGTSVSQHLCPWSTGSWRLHFRKPIAHCVIIVYGEFSIRYVIGDHVLSLTSIVALANRLTRKSDILAKLADLARL